MPTKPKVSREEITPYLQRPDLYTREIAAMFGYQASYVTDLRRKYGCGTGKRGGPNAAKITAAQAAAIRTMAIEGVPQKEIAAQFRTSRENVACIKSGRTWRDA